MLVPTLLALASAAVGVVGAPQSQTGGLAELPPACALARVDARTLSEEDFRALYRDRTPLLLTHATEGWPAAESWATAERIALAHGDEVLEIQDPSLLGNKGSFAPVVRRVPLRSYLGRLSEEPSPLFHNRWLSLGDRLQAETVVNSTVVGRSLRIHSIFSLGAANTGVPLHSHTENWLAQVRIDASPCCEPVADEFVPLPGAGPEGVDITPAKWGNAAGMGAGPRLR